MGIMTKTVALTAIFWGLATSALAFVAYLSLGLVS